MAGSTTTSFFAPPDAFRGGQVILPPDEANHAARVLRCRIGDRIRVVDGEGGAHEVELEAVDRRQVVGRVLASTQGDAEARVRVTVALGVLKQRARFETFVEKAVELGVDRIVPLLTERTERPGLRRDRLEGILLAALKQSGRTRLPRLDDPVRFDDLVGRVDSGGRYLCHEATAPGDALASRLAAAADDEVCLLVGPEGGFSDAEVERALAAGWQAASLGPRRLRAETAAMAAATLALLGAPALSTDDPTNR